MSERNLYIDCLRAYACILVVIGHVILGVRIAGLSVFRPAIIIENFIYSFHVALFMFLSGYVYNMLGGWRRYKTRVNFVRHKIINLGIPYIFFSIFYIILNAFTPGTNHSSSLKDCTLILLKPVAQYWFLYSLFFFFVVWALLSNLLKEWQIMIIYILIGALVSIFKIRIASINIAFAYCIPFSIGACIPSIYVDKFDIKKNIAIVIGHILVFSLMYIFFAPTFVLKKEVFQLIGIIGSAAFISILQKIRFVEKFLIFIGKYSFPIYLLHTIFTSAIRIVLIKVGVTNYVIHVFLGVVLGILCPICIALVSSKTVILDFLFYPSKTIKKCKESAIKE